MPRGSEDKDVVAEGSCSIYLVRVFLVEKSFDAWCCRLGRLRKEMESRAIDRDVARQSSSLEFRRPLGPTAVDDNYLWLTYILADNIGSDEHFFVVRNCLPVFFFATMKTGSFFKRPCLSYQHHEPEAIFHCTHTILAYLVGDSSHWDFEKVMDERMHIKLLEDHLNPVP